MQRWCFTADVLTNQADLFGRNVELVATLVRNEQVVTFDAANRTLDHSFVLANAVMSVDDIATGLQIFEDSARGTTAGCAAFAGTTPTTEVCLADDCNARVWQ